MFFTTGRPYAPVLALSLPEGFELPKTGRRIIPHLVVPDLERTLEIALRLVPGVKRVYVVGGLHPMDRWFEDRARHDFKKWEGRLEFSYVSDPPLEEILTLVSNIPPDSIVFLNAFATDSTGKSLTTVEVSRQLARVSKAPVFGFLDTLLAKRINDMRNPDFLEAPSAMPDPRFHRFVEVSEELNQAGVIQFVEDPRQEAQFNILITR